MVVVCFLWLDQYLNLECDIPTILLLPHGKRKLTALHFWTLAPLLSAMRVYYDALWA